MVDITNAMPQDETHKSLVLVIQFKGAEMTHLTETRRLWKKGCLQ